MIMPANMITEHRTCRPRTDSSPDRELSVTMPESSPILIMSHPTASPGARIPARGLFGPPRPGIAPAVPLVRSEPGQRQRDGAAMTGLGLLTR